MSIRARVTPRAIRTRTSCSRPDMRSSIIKGFATILGLSFLLLASLSIVSAQECITCNDDKPVKIGFTASVCSAHDYTVSLNGTSVEGIGSCTANSWMTTNKAFTYLKTDVTYQITAGTDSCSTHIVFDVPPKYTLEIDGVKTNTIDKSGDTTKGSGDGTWNVVIRKCRSCGDEAASSCELDLDSVNWSISMGRLSDGRSAEAISIQESSVSSSIYTPAALVYSPPGQTAEVDVVRNAGILRQIKASQALADVVVTSASEYEVRFYRLADVGTKTGGIYPVFNQPFTVWRIKNPDPTTTTRLQILKIQNGVTLETNEYTQDVLSNTWSLNQGAGATIKTLAVVNPTATTRIETTIIKESNGTIVSKIARTYHTYAWGDDLMKEVVDPDGAALTTIYTYYENPAEPGRYAHLQSVAYPDGSWEKSDYDTDGNLVLVMRPWKDLPLASATEANARSTRYTYSNSDGVETSLYAKHISSVEEKIAGTLVSKTVYTRSSTPVGGEPAATEVETVYASATLFQSISTTTYHFTASTFLANRVAAITHPDGRKDTYTYEKGDYVTNADPALNTFTPNANGLAERTTVVHGTASSPNGVAFKTQKETAIRDQLGHTVLEEAYVYNGTNYERVGWTAVDYDTRGHVILARDHKGQTRSLVWNGDLKTAQTDVTGIETNYTYDSLNRVKTQIKKGAAAGGGFPSQADITTTFTYDAAGRQTAQSVSSSGLTLSKSSVYDLAGRIKNETDNAGLSTSYSYANGGRTQTATLAGGAMRINDKFLDGQNKSVTGTSVVAQYSEYGVNVDGTRYTQEFTGSAGLSSPRWIKTTIDWMGRNVAIEKPGFTANNPIESFVYNNQGQLQSQSLKAGATKLIADKLYEYDELGTQVRDGSDVDASGTLTLASTDRLTETEVVFQKIGSDWFRVTTTRTYLVDNDVTPTTQTQTERLNNFALNGTDRTVSEITATNVAGNSTKTTVAIDRAARKVTTTADAADSDVNAVSISVNGLLQSSTPATPQPATTYLYDALGRQTSVTDPRTGTVTGTYSATTGQVTATNDGAGTTTYQYYPGSHVSAGRVQSHTNPVGKKVYFNYSLRGDMIQTWGDTTYPVEFVFDSYGQKTEMHTFRNGTGWAASAWPSASTGVADATKWIYHEATGLVAQKQDAATKAVIYTHDEMGRVKTRTWARGNISTYSYDPNTGEMIGQSYSDGTTPATFAYDRGGRPKMITDAAGTHERTFTATGELQTEQITGGILDSINLSVGYDGFLRRNSLQSASGANTLSSQTYGYDSSSRMQTVTSGGQTATYAYYSNSGLLNTTTFTSGTQLARSYDPLGRLQSILTTTPPTGALASNGYQYNNLNQRTRQNREDGAYWLYVYNDRGELISGKKNWSDNSPVWGAQTENSYDSIGNRTSARSGGNLISQLRQSTFTTNSLNQYSQRSVPGAVDITGTANSGATVTVNDQSTARKGEYFYRELAVDNTAGPVNAQISVTGARQNFGAGGEDAVTQKGGQKFLAQTTESLTFDFDGNLTSDGRWNYTWDAENRLVSMEAIPSVPVDAKKKLEFAYDAIGRRIQKKAYSWNVGGSAYQLQSTTKFVYDEWNVIAEVDQANSPIKNYAWGQDLSTTLHGAGGIGGLLLISDSTGVYQAGYDGNGNVNALINAATGLSAAFYDYDPFGNTIRATGSFASSNSIRFSSKYEDLESGLIYYGHRYYDPSTGRFINRDPIEENDGPNTMAFVGNDPIDFVDPLGLRKLTSEEGARAIRAGIPMLERACRRGCGKGACCAPKGCIQEARDYVELAAQAWIRNWGRGPMNDSLPGSDTVGGYYCWDWERIFADVALSRDFNCLAFHHGMAKGPPTTGGNFRVHWYLKVYACQRIEDTYRVSFDDGFLDGRNAAHRGKFPPRGSPFEEQAQPWWPDRRDLNRFTPAPRTRP